MRYLFIAVSVILLCSCVESSKKEERTYQEGGVLKEYSQVISTVDTLFFSHFPKSLERDEFKEYNFSGEKSYSGYPRAWVVLKKSEEEIEKLNEKFIAKYPTMLNAADSNLLVINTWKSLKESGFSVARDDKTIKRLEEIGKSEYPIPNFYELKLDGGEKNVCQLSSDFTIIVIRAEKGIFGKFDELADRSYVPSSWVHGYSKGVAISKKQNLIIYWCAIW